MTTDLAIRYERVDRRERRPRGLVESADSAVFEWVETTIESCRREAVPTDPDSLIVA